MTKGRLEAFTDGVIAIIITIMVLELKVPHGADLTALQASLPVFLAYVLSYVNVGIFWNNHHHMMHAAARIDGKVLWANLTLLFWMSLIPFVIRWMDEAGLTVLADLWRRAGDGSHQLPSAPVGDRRLQRPEFHARRRGRKRSKGQVVHSRVRPGDSPGIRQPMDRGHVVRRDRAHVVRA
jgi:hypothetical protein